MGTLYVVATPIGNLEDITLRALRVLREVQLIAAEDTRRTAKLLQHYSIATPTTSLHEHNEYEKTPGLIARLQAGDDVALVSDAGTPSISDPGQRLVLAARRAGQAVVAVPGASAVLTALAASGLEADRFSFLGFPPRKANALRKWVEAELLGATHPVVFYEAPHRLRQTLAILSSCLGDRPIIIARELTKLHEELVERPITAHLRHFDNPRGEFTVVVPPAQPTASEGQRPTDQELASEVGQIAKHEGLSLRESAKRVASRHGLSANAVYKLAAVRKR